LTAGFSLDQAAEARRGFLNFEGAVLGVAGALRRDESNRVRSFDQYAQAQWELAERWSLSAGLRHSRVSFVSRDRYIVPGNPDDSGAVSYGAVTPVAGLVFRLSDAVNLYGSLGRGFETPTFNELSYRPSGATGLNFGLRSASSRQWELGVKAELGPRWRLNAAYFQARTADEIVVLGNTGGRSTFQNAGATRRDGIETSLAGRWAGGWSAYLAASYIDARYSRGFLTCAAAPCAAPSTPIAAGNRIPGVARSSLFAELAWSHRPWGLETALEWRQVGRIYVDDQNSDAAPRAGTLALRASLAQQAGRWSFAQFVRVDNLTGRRYAGSVIVNEGNGRFFEPAPGRGFAVKLAGGYAF
jgi:iron complex outermembrane receptor protein